MTSHPADQNNPDRKETVQDAKALLAEITHLARDRKFSQAEALREQLMEADPSALSEIIKSADIIEKEKTAGLDPDHLAMWDRLYQELNEEETNCLFYSLKKIVVPPKKRILAHGGYNTRLYFIEKGTVTVFSQKDGKNKMIAQLGRGDLLGEYTFTTISVCSASVVSKTEIHLRYLESSATDEWHQEQPGLYEKLTRFCTQYGQVNVIEDRRKHEEEGMEHHTVDGMVVAYPLTKEGKRSTTYFRGGLTQISTDGCCFEIKSSKKETVRALLAKNLFMALALDKSLKDLTFSLTGRVERVTFHLHNDYSVYVTFHKPLLKAELTKSVSREG